MMFIVYCLKNNVISVGQLVEKAYDIYMKENSLSIRSQVRELIAKVDMTNNRLYTFDMQTGIQHCSKSVTET